MNEYISSILRIGLVNSGMFDLLNLNLDVTALHLVAGNNVGKTSLIELIQFLYFHDLREMTFSKSQAESLAFYFRPEGSYILFEVRTISGGRRSVGIYGRGTADSREIFVFDGAFQLEEFLDGNRCVIPLQEVQSIFFDRAYRRFRQFDHFEKGLLGSHTESEYNVQLFDISVPNFRLLRKLLQGLLRLDKIASSDVRDVIIKMVEKGAVKTKINIARDFERKNRDINTIRAKLNELMRLKPIIELWQMLNEKKETAQQQLGESSERLYHLSGRYLSDLKGRKSHLQSKYVDFERQWNALSDEHKGHIESQASCRIQLEKVENLIKRYKELDSYCSRFDRIHVEQERDRLTYQKVELETMLADVKPEKSAELRRQLRQRESEITRIRRLMEKRTLEQLWIDAQFAKEHRALLKFLLSRNLTSLTASTVLADKREFLTVSQNISSYMESDGTFKGFGLTIPKSEWCLPEEETEPLEVALARLQEEIRTIKDKIDTAENREKRESELLKIKGKIAKKQAILLKFEHLAQWENEHDSLASCEGKQKELAAKKGAIAEELKIAGQKMEPLRKSMEKLHTRQNKIEEEIRQAEGENKTIQPFDSQCPSSIQDLPESTLVKEYQQNRKQVKQLNVDLLRFINELREPEAQLESRYDLEAQDIPFEEWIKKNLNITAEIIRFESQLQETYNNLLILVKGELDKLTQAFDAVRNKVVSLNASIRNVSISNIDRIEVDIKESAIVKAIRKMSRMQMDLFSIDRQDFSSEEAQQIMDEYLGEMIRNYGREIDLKDMFRLEFKVRFSHSSKPATTFEIHKFESHGTETSIKIVLYLGLIGLLQDRRRIFSARIPFFLDEVGSIDSNNLKQLISYCSENNFLPIFASTEIRKDIPHNSIFRRDGRRSSLINEVIITQGGVQ